MDIVKVVRGLIKAGVSFIKAVKSFIIAEDIIKNPARFITKGQGNSGINGLITTYLTFLNEMAAICFASTLPALKTDFTYAFTL